METPPDSSFAQSSSLFSGQSKEDVIRSILLQAPSSDHNSLTNSSDRSVAISATGPLKDFKFDDFREGYRMMNFPPKYPFQSIAQIENYKFDPYYFDGSENSPNININENLIGTPMGTSLLEDPRLAFTKNMMILKEYEGQADQLNDAYIKELYMVNSEKGSNYYINMLERQQEGLDYWSREGRKRKNSSLPGIAFSYNLPQGETQRTKKQTRVAQTVYSATPNVQRNFRQQQFENAPRDDNDTVSTRSGTITTRSGDDETVSLYSGRMPPPNTPNSRREGSVQSEVITLGSRIVPNADTPFDSIPNDIGLGTNLKEDLQSVGSESSMTSSQFESKMNEIDEMIAVARQGRGKKFEEMLIRVQKRYNGNEAITPISLSSRNSASDALGLNTDNWNLDYNADRRTTATSGGHRFINSRLSGASTEFGSPPNVRLDFESPGNEITENAEIISSRHSDAKRSPTSSVSSRRSDSSISRREKEEYRTMRNALSLNKSSMKELKRMEKGFEKYEYISRRTDLKQASDKLHEISQRRDERPATIITVDDAVGLEYRSRKRFQSFLNEFP